MPGCPSSSPAAPITRSAPAELAQWLERFVLEDGVGLIGGCCGTEAAHIAALDAMLRRIGRDRPRPAPRQRKPGLGPFGRLALRPGQPAPGERVSVDRRALQRQRLAAIPPIAGAGRLGRLRRDGPRAGQGRLAHARSLHRLCRPRRDRRHDRGGDPHARRGQRAARHQLDRIPGARSRPQALWRQADHQLDQFRGRRRGGRQAPEAGAALRHGGHRADDRRDRHGQGGRAQTRRSRAGSTISPAASTACRRRTCCSTR